MPPTLNAVAAPEFFGYQGTARAWGTFKNCAFLPYFESKFPPTGYTVYTNGSTHGRKIAFCEKMARSPQL